MDLMYFLLGKGDVQPYMSQVEDNLCQETNEILQGLR